MSQLHYTATDGRFLNGVPAADFETDDPDVIAVCLASGLYERADAKPKRAATPAPETPAAAPVTEDPNNA